MRRTGGVSRDLDWRALLAAVTPDRHAPADPDGEVRTRSSLRIAWLGTIVAIGYLVLAAKAGALMILPDPRLEGKAKVQFEKLVELRGRRGDIIDRHGAILATTVELDTLHVDPSRLTPPLVKELSALLAQELDMDAAHLASRLGDSSRQDVIIERGLTPTDSRRIVRAARAVAKRLDGPRGVVWTDAEPHRYYPGVDEAAPLLGLVGHTGAGTAGLERTLDRVLRGEVHKYVQWRDRKGRRVTPDTIHVEEGRTVVLTLDRRIQHVAELAVRDAIERTKAQAAFAVVVDVPTGELLALANWPSQNPNETSSFDMTQFKNRAAMDAFEPGSVFKPFVAAAAMEEGLVTPTTPIDCEGGIWAVGRKRIHDDHPHGVVSLSEVIKYSSNIGAAKLGLRLGGERAIAYLTDLGFGRSIGFELPGETRGQVRDGKTIRPIELATTSYGHGVSVNAMQLAYAVATLGNGGVRMKPMLVKEIRDSHGEAVERYEPEVDRRVFSERVARDTVEMMITVTEEGGTGTRARVPGYLVAGKTGTAWKHVGTGYSATERIGSFVGVLPADAPRLAIVVTVDTPTEGSSYGGIVAGPAFAMIGKAAVRLLDIPPDPDLLAEAEADEEPDEADATEEESAGPPVPMVGPELTWTSDGRLRTPDLRGLSLRDSLVTLQGAGLTVEVNGSGRVARQEPPPGARVGTGDRVEVFLE